MLFFSRNSLILFVVFKKKVNVYVVGTDLQLAKTRKTCMKT